MLLFSGLLFVSAFLGHNGHNGSIGRNRGRRRRRWHVGHYFLLDIIINRARKKWRLFREDFRDPGTGSDGFDVGILRFGRAALDAILGSAGDFRGHVLTFDH